MDTADSKLEGTAGVPPAKLTGGIPDLSLRQAEQLNRLGQLHETYTPDPSSSRLLWTGFMVFLLLFGLLVSAIPFLPPPKDVAPAPLPLVLLVVLVIGFILVACVWRLRQLTWERRARILVFAEGLARFDGKSLLTCRGEVIESVQGVLDPGLRVRAITANAGERALVSLSVGTRDQLATLVRLNLAAYLKTVLVLDDQLAQTDPQRLAWFRDRLRASVRDQDHQIIVITCRPRDYVDQHEMPAPPCGRWETDDGKVAVVDVERVASCG